MSKVFLNRYSGQTIDELIAMKESYRIDSLVLAIEQALVTRPEAELSNAERVVLAVEALEREVNNGGYQQFFMNSPGEFTPFIVQALELIGCPKCAAITASAIAELNLPDDFEADAVHKAASELSEESSERLGKADSRYYKNDENIEQSLFEYIEGHSHEFQLPHST
jgi:hypothetical protein